MIQIGYKELQIVEILLEKKDTLILEEIAKNLNLSQRAIKYSLMNLINFLKENKLGKCIRYNNENITLKDQQGKVIKLLKNLTRNQYYLSRDERIEILHFKYLLDKDLTLDEIAKFLKVSRSTIKQDIHIFRSILDEYDLTLVSVAKLGLKVYGKEEDIRKVLLEIIYANVNLNFIDNQENIGALSFNPFMKNIIDKIVSKSPIKKLNCIVRSYEKEFSQIVSDEVYKIVLIYLIILYNRNLNGFKIGRHLEFGKIINIDVKKFFKDKFKEKLNMDVDLIEFSDLGSCLISKEERKYGYKTKCEFIGLSILSHRMIMNIVKNNITAKNVIWANEEVKRSMDVFYRHFYLAVERTENRILIKNPVLNEIKKINLKLFEDIKEGSKEIEKYIGEKFSEDEIAYFTILITNIIEKIEQLNNKVRNVVIVCGMGNGTSRIIEEKIYKNFEVNIKHVLSHRMLNSLKDKEDIDLIISTVPLKNDGFVKTIYVNPLLTAKDIKNLKNAGVKEKNPININSVIETINKYSDINDEEKLKKELSDKFSCSYSYDEKEDKKRIYNLLSKDRISFEKDILDWEEAIRKSGELLLKDNCIDESYIDRMIKIVKKYHGYVTIGEGIAIPHAENKDDVYKTAMSLLRLDSPVIFNNGKKVNTIISFCSIDGIEHIAALIDLLDLVEKKKFIKHINMFKEAEELYEYIRNFNNLKGDTL
ncbi:BglG family transcription antiterminator [Clostridium oceanicum]|uniref:BglG family transcription antiterminator n=1 Tax=Clostridium oceanicum TaxID=1543 RepID=A0ABN1J931_9CLOT